MKLHQAKGEFVDGNIALELSAFGNPAAFERFKQASYSIHIAVLGEMLAVHVLLTPDGIGDAPMHQAIADARVQMDKLREQNAKLEETVNTVAQQYLDLAIQKARLLQAYESAHDYSLAGKLKKAFGKPPELPTPASFR